MISMYCRYLMILFCIELVSMETAKIPANYRMCMDLLCMRLALVTVTNATNAMLKFHWWRHQCVRYACWCLVHRDFSRRNDGNVTTEYTMRQDLELVHANRQRIEDDWDRMREHCGLGQIVITYYLEGGCGGGCCVTFVYLFLDSIRQWPFHYWDWRKSIHHDGSPPNRYLVTISCRPIVSVAPHQTAMVQNAMHSSWPKIICK